MLLVLNSHQIVRNSRALLEVEVFYPNLPRFLPGLRVSQKDLSSLALLGWGFSLSFWELTPSFSCY